MNKKCLKCGYKLKRSDKFCPNCGAAVEDFQYAGFFLRFFAKIIDTVIIYAIALLILSIIEVLFPGSILNNTSLIVGICIAFFPSVIAFFYHTILESSGWKATLGKRIMEIQVVDYNYEKISYFKAIIRFVTKILSAITLLIGFIMAGFTEKKQALHDLIAKTYVVKNTSIEKN